MTVPLLLADPTNAGNAPGDGPLRPGGQPTGLPVTEQNLPSTPSRSAKRQQRDLTLVRDVWAGNSRLHEEGPEYLPQAPGEDPKNYASRLARAVFFNVFRNTIEGLVGYVFRKDPELGDDVPARIVADWENLDNAGTHGDVFVRERMADAMTAGHGAILVEFPQTGGQQTAGQEQRGEVRPYWVPILKDHILSWRTTTEFGRMVLTQLVVRECAMVPDGEFGEKEQVRYRVFYRTGTGSGAVVGFRLLEVTPARSVIEVDAGTYPTQDEIPVSEIVTAGKRGLFESDPPFLDLAYLNLAHYRQWSDYDTSIHKTCVPIYWEAGVSPEAMGADGQPVGPLVLGPNTARRSTDPGFKIGYASHDGASLGSCKTSLDDLKNDMAALGLAALASQKRTAETATAKELDKGASDSALAVHARGLQDGVERALGFHARYYRLPSGGSITINRDYGVSPMDPSEMTAWATLAEKIGVPVRTVLEALVRGGKIPDGTDLDALEQEMLTNQAARMAEEAQRREDALASLTGAAA